MQGQLTVLRRLVGLDKYEFRLRLVAIISVIIITIINALTWKIDHTFLLYVGLLIGLLAGIRLKPVNITVEPKEGD